MACRVCKRGRCVYERIRRRRLNPSEARRLGAIRGWEHRKESDDAVTANLDPHELALWEKTKGGFKGSADRRYEAFRDYVHDHPGEVGEALDDLGDAKLRELVKARERVRMVEVPCETPYRVRTKELCRMGNPKKKWRIVTVSGPGLPHAVDVSGYDTRFAAESMASEWHEGKYRIESYVPRGGDGGREGNPKKRKRGRQKNAKPAHRKGKRRKANGLFGESSQARERRLSDERARKKREAQQAANIRRKKAKRGKRRSVVGRLANHDLGSSVAKVEAFFKKIHWGVPEMPAKEKAPTTLYVASSKTGENLAVLGELESIAYITRKGVLKKKGKPRPRGRVAYDHDFDEGKTWLLSNTDGELFIGKTSKTGGYRVTERGIEG